MQMYPWGQGCLEFVATGTAVRQLAGTGAPGTTSHGPGALTVCY
jgi:hypothetical protein